MIVLSWFGARVVMILRRHEIKNEHFDTSEMIFGRLQGRGCFPLSLWHLMADVLGFLEHHLIGAGSLDNSQSDCHQTLSPY